MTSSPSPWQSRDPTTNMTPDESTRTFLLSALLPSLIQRRMPKLRRAFSHFETTTTTSCHSRAYSEEITPPPSYPQSELEDLYETMPSTPRRPLSSSGSATPSNVESKSGINWRYADPGFSHLSLAAQEAAGMSPSSTFVRRQYIDGVACMLRGLPRDMSEEEELSLREALPVCLTSQSRTVEQALIRAGFSNPSNKPGHVPISQRSTLHQLVALLTLYIFLSIAALLPYLQLFLQRAWQYDREYRISDRVWAKSVEVADVMGKRTLVLAQNFCALHDGKVGDVVKETGIYLVQGVSGGVYDGLGEAMRMRGREEER